MLSDSTASTKFGTWHIWFFVLKILTCISVTTLSRTFLKCHNFLSNFSISRVLLLQRDGANCREVPAITPPLCSVHCALSRINCRKRQLICKLITLRCETKDPTRTRGRHHQRRHRVLIIEYKKRTYADTPNSDCTMTYLYNTLLVRGNNGTGRIGTRIIRKLISSERTLLLKNFWKRVLSNQMLSGSLEIHLISARNCSFFKS